EEGIAMRALDALDALLGQDLVELAAGAAIAVEAEDLVIAGARRVDLAPDAGRDLLRPVVPDRRQAGHVDMVEAVRLDHRERLARQRTAGYDEGAPHRLSVSSLRAPSPGAWR